MRTSDGLPDKAKAHFQKTVSRGEDLIRSIDVIVEFYANVLRIDEKYEDIYSLRQESQLLREAKGDVVDAMKRAALYLRNPQKYWRLPEVERVLESADFDPDAVLDEIAQHEDLNQHQEIIDEITRGLKKDKDVQGSAMPFRGSGSLMFRFGKFLRRMGFKSKR